MERGMPIPSAGHDVGRDGVVAGLADVTFSFLWRMAVA
jgi:hypothetical protein